jgi:hypothetical protein
MKDPKRAFDWITTLLDELGCPYVVVGGLAANVFGGRRPLYDIDLDVHKSALPKIADRAKLYVTFGPARYQDAHFDIELLSLRYAEQDIDLTAGEDVLLFDSRVGRWCEVPTDFSVGEHHEVLGKRVPVMGRAALIEYKRMLSRDTDLEDVAAMGG